MNEENANEKPKQSQCVVYHHSTSYNLFILALTIFSQVVVAGIIFRPVNADVLGQVDFLICMVFLLDFSISLWRAPSRVDYFFAKGGWLDLLGAIPGVPGLSWTAVLRLARLNRLVRTIKHLQAKDRDEVIQEARQNPSRAALLTIIITAFVLITLASLLIVRFERGAADATIQTGRDAFWWTLVTITTVGYGDYVPVTFPGRILAIVLMTFGIGIFAVLTSFVAARVVALQDDGRPDQEDIAKALREENAIIRAELAEIKQLLKQGGSMDDEDGQ